MLLVPFIVVDGGRAIYSLANIVAADTETLDVRLNHFFK